MTFLMIIWRWGGRVNSFEIQHKTQVSDGIAGFKEDWTLFKNIEGYIDLITGTDLNNIQNSFIEQSTHILIIPDYTEGITDEMRVVDEKNRYYSITYSDDPVGQHHHNEIYLKYSGDLNV